MSASIAIVNANATFNTIEEYNTHLLDSNVLMTPIAYLKNVNNLFLKSDLSFMEKFMELCDRTDFCIPQEYLQEYGVLNNLERSNDVLKCLTRHGLSEENGDYLLRQVAQQLPSGTKHSKVYTLTPRAFKLCLIRAKNTRVYANYYLDLEYTLKHYNEYHLEFVKKHRELLENENIKLKMKCQTFEEIVAETREQLAQTSEQLAQNREQLTKSEELREEGRKLMMDIQADRLRQEEINKKILEKLNISEHRVQNQQAHIQEIVPDRVIRPQPDKCGTFVLMKIGEGQFSAIRCQQKAKAKGIKNLKKKHPDAEVWFSIDYHPNPVNFWNVVKKRIEFTKCKGNSMMIKPDTEKTEEDLKNILNEIEVERLEE